MRVLKLNEYINLPKDLNTNQVFRKEPIDVALLTFEEYYKIVNPDNTWHDECWDYSVARLNERPFNKSHMKLIQRKKYGNMTVEFYEESEKRGYGYHDENGKYISYTDEEIVLKGLPLYEIAIYAVQDNKKIGYIGDEWGATLVYVAREYKGNNIGKDLTYMFRKKQPDRHSGGFTNAGDKNIKNIYREFVKEYMRNGIYSYLVKNGDISAAKVKEIISSADLQNYKPNVKVSEYAKIYSNTFDNNTLVYRYNNNMNFIIFDKRLIDYYQEKSYDDMVVNHLLKAHVYLTFNNHFEKYELFNSFGQNIKFEKACLDIALQTLKNEENEGCMIRVTNSLSEQTKNIVSEYPSNNDLEYPVIESIPYDYKVLFDKTNAFINKIDRVNRSMFTDYLMELAHYTSDITD